MRLKLQSLDHRVYRTPLAPWFLLAVSATPNSHRERGNQQRFDGRREATLRDWIDRKKRTPLNSEVLVFFDRSDRASRPATQADPSNRDSTAPAVEM
jgi:hypothetical protein